MTAYDEIVRRYQQSVAASLYRFSNNHADLEDLVQETFIRAYQKLQKWTNSASLLSWIRKIGYNLSYDYLRKQKRNPLANRADESAARDDETNTAHYEIADETPSSDSVKDNDDLVTWLLTQLRAEEAMAVSMFYLDQLSTQEIAERMDWSLSKVKVKIHRSRKKLKLIFDANEENRLQYSTTI